MTEAQSSILEQIARSLGGNFDTSYYSEVGKLKSVGSIWPVDAFLVAHYGFLYSYSKWPIMVYCIFLQIFYYMKNLDIL